MYNHIAASYNQLHGAEQRRKLSILLARANLKSNFSVLDVGCATAHLASLLPSNYVGIDPSSALIDLAPSGVNARVGRGEELDFDDESFDIVLSLTALHNYDNPLLGVDELVRVSKNLLLVGVLKKSAVHDAIVTSLLENCYLVERVDDIHDTLLVLSKRRT